MEKSISFLDQSCNEFVLSLPVVNTKFNASVELSPENTFIYQTAVFLNLDARKAVTPMTTKRIRLLHHHHFTLSVFREKLQNISKWREFVAHNRRRMFLPKLFVKRGFNTSFNDKTTTHTFIYFQNFVLAV